MPKTKSQKKYKKKCWRLSIDFYPTEEDLWNRIKSQPQKQTYIKNLIRKDLETQTDSNQYRTEPRTCPSCHSVWHHRETICPNCGTKISAEETGSSLSSYK